MISDPFTQSPKLLDELKVNREPLSFNDFPFIIAIDKPVGLSSFDCIRRMRPRLFETLGKGKGRRKIKIGHFGTLDPFADGVLLVGTGKAMKLMNLIQERLKKCYSAQGVFGKRTITGDREGEFIGQWSEELGVIDQEDLLSSIQETSLLLKKEYLQVPPYFSAVKHEGKPLYEYARKGVFIEKRPVERKIYELEIEKSEIPNEFIIDCSVSSGTYIRGLWQDLLSKFEKMGYLKTLTRVSYGPISQQNCVKLEDFCQSELKNFDYILPWDLLDLETIELDKIDAGAFLQGAFLEKKEAQADQYYWINYSGSILGLGLGFEDSGQVKVKADINFY